MATKPLMGPKGRLRLKRKMDEFEGVISPGMTPLEFLVNTYRDDSKDEMGRPNVDLDVRVQAAKAAAVYVHKKMPVDMNVNTNKNITKRIILQRADEGTN